MPAAHTIWYALHLLLPLVLSPLLQAQSSRVIGFRRLTVDDGLPQSTVNCIVQDRDGYLWFGTQDGLSKFDGYTFQVYRKVPGVSSSLSDNYITSLLTDTHGSLWVGTYSGGVNRLDPGGGTVRRYSLRSDGSSSRGSRSVMAIAEDSSGTIWVATWGGGLDMLDAQSGAWTHFEHEKGHDSASTGDRSTSIAVDRQGRLWLGTWDGLHTFDSSTRTLRYSTPDVALSLEDRKIMAVYPAGDGTVWYGTFAGGLFRYDPRVSTLARVGATGQEGRRLSGNSVRAVVQDADARLWIGTWGGGINVLEQATGAVQVLRAGPFPALRTDQVLALCLDRSGGIWAGLEGGGVNHYDPARFKFRHIRHDPASPTALSRPVVRSLCQDRHGHVWVGSEAGGLDCLDPVTAKVIPGVVPRQGRQSVGSNTVLALLEDSEEYLWAGTDGGGLHRLDPSHRKWQRIPLQRLKDEIIGPDHVIWLCESRDGTLWIGTLGGGLIRMNRATLEQVRYLRTSRTASDQLSGNYVYCLLEDRDRRLWVGTWGAGISVLDPRTGSFVVYQHDETDPQSLAQNSILHIHQDRKGTIWVATLGGGLDAFDPSTNSFIHVTEADGLPNNVVNGILEDDSGSLWLSTNRGLCRFDPTARTFRNYDVGDGLQSMEFNQGALCRGRDGTLYFGGVNGLNMFSPADLPTDTVPPPVYITRCSVFDRPLPLPLDPRGLELTYDHNFVSFEFTALDFTAPEKNAYRYMMEGIDRDWIASGSRRFASYVNLSPGDYLFRVRGSNNDDVWNASGASLRIRVSPPFWGTAWFRTLALLLILGSVYSLYRRRINTLERERQIQSDFSRKLNESQETERKRIAGELHDGLGQELLTIKNTLSGLVSRSETAPRSQLAELETAVHRAIEDVRQISADLHPHMLERLGLTRTIESTIRHIGDAACLKIVALVDPVDGLLPPSEEINFYRIIQEALANVVKHSDASQCTVRVERTASQIHLTVQDDGRGFEPDAAATSETAGLGLTNMAERIRMMRGDMEIRSAPGTGTILRFHVPLSGPPAGDSAQDNPR